MELANARPQSLEKLLKGIKVVAIGPGLGTEGEASEFARALVERATLPMVIDADALNAFAGKTDLAAQREPTVAHALVSSRRIPARWRASSACP